MFTYGLQPGDLVHYRDRTDSCRTGIFTGEHKRRGTRLKVIRCDVGAVAWVASDRVSHTQLATRKSLGQLRRWKRNCHKYGGALQSRNARRVVNQILDSLTRREW
jgi:hypothetical protein